MKVAGCTNLDAPKSASGDAACCVVTAVPSSLVLRFLVTLSLVFVDVRGLRGFFSLGGAFGSTSFFLRGFEILTEADTWRVADGFAALGRGP